MINAGNPSAYNLKLRKMAAENKQSSSEIFKKLNKRGVIDPKQTL